MEVDLTGTFSNIPIGFVLVEDIRSYIHVKLDEFSHHGKILDLWIEKVIAKSSQVKLEFKTLVEKRLNTWHDFLNFCHDEKWVRLALSRFHNEFMWLDQTHLITKDLMRAITSLSDFGDIPSLKLAREDAFTAYFSLF